MSSLAEDPVSVLQPWACGFDHARGLEPSRSDVGVPGRSANVSTGFGPAVGAGGGWLSLVVGGCLGGFATVGGLAWSGLALVLVVWAAFRLRRVRGASGNQKLLVFTQWAEHEITESRPVAHRQMLDDVISTFANYAQRLESPRRAVRHTAVLRLRLLSELLERPGVSRALRDVNWEWVRDWDTRQLSRNEMRRRCTIVFPTILAASKVRHNESHDSRNGKGSSPNSIFYLAGWCADFLERPDVRASLESPGRVEGRLPDESCVLFSESSEDDDDAVFVPAKHPSTSMSVSSEVLGSDLTAVPAEGMPLLRRQRESEDHCWDDVDPTTIRVRSKTYLQDSKKLPSAGRMLDLLDMDVFTSAEEIVHYASSPGNAVQKIRNDWHDDRFLFVVNWRIPPLQVACTWAVPKNADWLSQTEGVLFRRFCEMTDDERNARFKLIPRVVEGPWLVKRSLPEKPAILARKLSIEYFVEDNYLEISINAIASPAGRHICKLMKGAARHFSIQIFILIEGHAKEELPERVLCGFHAVKADLSVIPQR